MSKKLLGAFFLFIHLQVSSFWSIPGVSVQKMSGVVTGAYIKDLVKGKFWTAVSKFQSVPPVIPFRAASQESVSNFALCVKNSMNLSLSAFVLNKKQSIVEAFIAFKNRSRCLAYGQPIMSSVQFTQHTTGPATQSSAWAQASNFFKVSTESAGSSFAQHNMQTQYKWYSLFGPKFYAGISEATLKVQKSASFWKGSFFGSVTTAATVAWVQGKQKKQEQTNQ